MVNTTRNIRTEVPKGVIEDVPADTTHRVQTSEIYEVMEDLDGGDEIVHVLPGGDWFAEFADGHREPLVLWTVMDDGTVYGVVVGEDGSVNANESVVDRQDFEKYINNSKEG